MAGPARGAEAEAGQGPQGHAPVPTGRRLWQIQLPAARGRRRCWCCPGSPCCCHCPWGVGPGLGHGRSPRVRGRGEDRRPGGRARAGQGWGWGAALTRQLPGPGAPPILCAPTAPVCKPRCTCCSPGGPRVLILLKPWAAPSHLLALLVGEGGVWLTPLASATALTSVCS